MRKRNGVVRAAALAVVATVGLATAAGAQWRVTGFGGVYAPTADIGKYTEPSGGVSMKHKTGFIVGLNANNWFMDRAGFEGTFAYVNSDATLTEFDTGPTPGSGSMTHGGNLYLGAAKLLFGLTPHTSNELFYLSAGPAIIGVGGSAYNEQSGIKVDRSTSVGGVVGLGARLHLNDLWCFKLAADNYMYSSNVKVYTTRLAPAVSPSDKLDLGSKFQNDLVFSAGVSLLMPW